jgi:hypothetical protein
MASHDKTDVETLSHVVFRFLQTALQSDPAIRTLHTPNAEKALAFHEGRLIVDHSNEEKWAWKDRLSTWARLVSPTGAPHLEFEAAEASDTEATIPRLPMKLERSSIPAPTTPEIPTDTLQQNISSSTSPVGDGLTIQESTRFPYQPVRWSSSLRTTTSAVFGHVLTLIKEHTGKSSALSANASLDSLAMHTRIFSPIIPHPLNLAKLSTPIARTNGNDIIPTISTILVRFKHNPESATRALPLVAPPLELRLSLSEPLSVREDPEITGIHSLRAVTATNHEDVLLPADAVDIRITQISSAELEGSRTALRDWQPIVDFLARSRLDFSAGKLEMAAQQRFQIPLRLFNKSSSPEDAEEKPQEAEGVPTQAHKGLDSIPEELRLALSRIVQPKNETGPDSLQSTLYEFAGLELHRSMTMPYPADERFSLVYTSIEAGVGGGRRAELSLLPVPSSSASSSQGQDDAGQAAPSGSEADIQRHDDYLRACFKLAQTAKNWYGFSDEVKNNSV